MLNPPFVIGQVLINKFDYQTLVVENTDYRDGVWFALVTIGDERRWFAVSTIKGQGFVPLSEINK